MSTDAFVRVYVRPDLFPYLVITCLEVMHGSDPPLDFSTQALATVRPAEGYLELRGPHHLEARDEIEKRLQEEHGVTTSALPVPI